MNKKILAISAAVVSLTLPFWAMAFNNPGGVQTIDIDLLKLLNSAFTYVIWPIITAGVIIMFLLAGFEFLTANGDTAKLSKARNAVIWGVAGVFVIVLSFSIMSFVGRLTGAIPECTVDADCNGGNGVNGPLLICKNNVCTSVQCKVDADCSNPFTPNCVNNVCVQ